MRHRTPLPIWWRLVTGYHNNESTAFHLLYLRVCYSGMLFGVALAAVVAWVLRKINS